MNRAAIDLWVGFFVAIGLAALLFLALKVGNLSSSDVGETYGLQARFDNIGGLKVRAPVKSAGVVVGRVGEIRFDAEDYRALVSMQIDKRYQFPKDTSAAVLTSGLLGEQYVGFEAGAEEAMLANGDDPAKADRASFDRAVALIEPNVSNGQIRAFTGNDYKELIVKGDVAACVAWRGDTVQIGYEDANIVWVTPEGGGGPNYVGM